MLLFHNTVFPLFFCPKRNTSNTCLYFFIIGRLASIVKNYWTINIKHQRRGFGTEELESAKMADSRSEEKNCWISLLNDKDHKNAGKATKERCLIFEALKFTAKIIVLQNTIKYILSFFEIWKYFEWIIKQSLNSAFVWYEELSAGVIRLSLTPSEICIILHIIVTLIQ